MSDVTFVFYGALSNGDEFTRQYNTRDQAVAQFNKLATNRLVDWMEIDECGTDYCRRVRYQDNNE